MLRIQNVGFDATDPHALAAFWAEVLGWRVTLADEDEVCVEPPVGSAEEGVVPDLVFIRVPEPKRVKDRLHLDLRPDDAAAELARVESLGARRVDVGQGRDVTWTVLADPEGNEFCILRALRPDELG